MKKLKTLLFLVPLLFITTAGIAQTTVELAWDYDPLTITNATHDPVTGAVIGTVTDFVWPDVFILRGTKQANSPLTTWPVLVIIPAFETNVVTGASSVRTNYTIVDIPHGSYWFVMTASNSGGESFFSNTALRKPGAEPPANLTATKGR